MIAPDYVISSKEGFLDTLLQFDKLFFVHRCDNRAVIYAAISIRRMQGYIVVLLVTKAMSNLH